MRNVGALACFGLLALVLYWFVVADFPKRVASAAATAAGEEIKQSVHDSLFGSTIYINDETLSPTTT
jgi:plastocyanin domain-containing protein